MNQEFGVFINPERPSYGRKIGYVPQDRAEDEHDYDAPQ